MAKVAGYAFEVQQPDGVWSVLVPQLFKTRKGAQNAADRLTKGCEKEGWPTQARVIEVPAL